MAEEALVLPVFTREGQRKGQKKLLDVTSEDWVRHVNVWILSEEPQGLLIAKTGSKEPWNIKCPLSRLRVDGNHSSLSTALEGIKATFGISLPWNALEFLLTEQIPSKSSEPNAHQDHFLLTLSSSYAWTLPGQSTCSWEAIITLLGENYSVSESQKGILESLKTRYAPNTEEEEKRLLQMAEDYAPADLTADISHLEVGDRVCLYKLIEAADVINDIFEYQMHSCIAQLREHLQSRALEGGATDRLRWLLFRINKSPWSLLHHFQAFMNTSHAPLVKASDGVLQYRLAVPSSKPAGVNYYPPDMEKEEFQEWLAQNSHLKEAGEGYFHAIERDEATRELKVVPYSRAYQRWLAKAAELLVEASKDTTSESLREYLKLRSQAFLDNNYVPSDFVWLELDSPIDITIGPYETYKDDIFGAKAAFEVYIGIRDDAETAKLKAIGSKLQELESNLPMDERFKNADVGSAAPIRVMSVVCAGGDCAGPQTLAFNLPNDEKVVKKKGTAQVLMKNTSEAKFEKILLPMTPISVAESQQHLVTFDAFFSHTLCHELVHGIGPHTIEVNGKETTVRACHAELHSALEEAKADIVGLWATHYLIRQGVLPTSLDQTAYVTFLAGCFRSIRFGVREAHGKGQALIFNFLLESGAFEVEEESGKFKVNFEKVEEGVEKLGRTILHAQATGDKEAAKTLLETYGTIPKDSALERALQRIKDAKIPVDILPTYPLQELVKA